MYGNPGDRGDEFPRPAQDGASGGEGISGPGPGGGYGYPPEQQGAEQGQQEPRQPRHAAPAGSATGPAAGSPAATGPAISSPATGGRAERRRAAQGGSGRRRAGGSPAASASASAPAASAPADPGAGHRRGRRRAKPKPSVGVVVARTSGELFVTFGVLLLLFVAYQMWWTNVRAGEQSGDQVSAMEDKWAGMRKAGNQPKKDPRSPDAFKPGDGFALMYIPDLDVKAPVAQSVDKKKVLDRGMVGHYWGRGDDLDSGLHSAMPWEKRGNFAVAGHRNTHGEPFRFINRLKAGDKVVVETAATYYVYTITSQLATTPPSNVKVIDPIPAQSGFTEPGRYLTLTTCTPEFSSVNRLIVWGKLTEERPRSKGKPDALLR